MTRAEIRAAVIQVLRESADPVRWPVAELNRYIDDGYRDLAERTGAINRTFNMAILAETNIVPFPTTSGYKVLHPLMVKDTQTDQPIDPIHWTLADSTNRLWARSVSTYPYYFGFWDQFNIFLYPAYGANGTIAVTAAVIPDGLASDSAEPEFPEEHHDAIVSYVLWRCLMKGAKGARIGRAMRHLGFYSEGLQGLGDWTNDKHEGIFRAIYGQQLRVGTGTFYTQ